MKGTKKAAFAAFFVIFAQIYEDERIESSAE